MKRLLGLRNLKYRLKQFYKEHKVSSRMPLRRFTLTKIKSRKRAPKLKAKAAQARKLLPFAMMLVAEFRLVDGAFGEHRFQCLLQLCDIYELANKTELTDEELTQWRWKASLFLYHYVSCGFRVYPKFHYSFHMPEQIARSGVPRSFWVYSDESKNYQLKKIYQACGTSPAVCQSVLLHVEWLFRLEDLLASM